MALNLLSNMESSIVVTISPAPVLTLRFSRLVDEITYKKATEAEDVATATAILGPFFRVDAPFREKGDTITFNTPKDAEVTYMHGVVTDAKTKKPLPNAVIDVWECSTNGIVYSG